MGCGSGKPAATGGQATGGSEDQQFLAKVALFKRLPQKEHPGLAKCCQRVEFAKGAMIIKQGDVGDEFFIIKQGEANVIIDGKEMATLKTGDYFGEVALLRDEPRNATIEAKTAMVVLKITRASFDNLGLNEKLEFAKRGAVAAGEGTAVKIKPPSPKTPDLEALMKKALEDNINLNSMFTLDERKMKDMISLMWREPVKKGIRVIEQGNLDADYFYIIESGKFDIFVADGNGKPENVGSLARGQSFGELALMYLAARAATIEAKEDGTLWLIDRKQFQEIFRKSAQETSDDYMKYFDKVDILSPLRDSEKRELAKCLDEKYYTKDEVIFNQGDKADFFYILVQGEVAVIIDRKEMSRLGATAEKAQIFGEKALLNSEPRAATIQVVSATAKALAVDKVSFDMLLGSLEDLKARGKGGSEAVKKKEQKSAKVTGKIFRKDLKKLGLLGCGGFGAVEMVEHLPTAETYALKALSKGYIVKSGMQNSVMSEKNVQLLCDSDFIIQLYETYNGDQSLYLLMELALGGELFATYNKKRLWGKADLAQFYVAGTTFAFEHLHSKKIIYRDLKPENLLMNDKGYMKLTDMGLAKISPGKTFTTCGTPDYFAPELIASKGHTHAVDWWTLGILLFELMAGHPPFESGSPMQIYTKVAKGINKIVFPKACKGHVETLIKGLCHQTPGERLPMKKGDIGNIKTHPWYAGFDWDAMLHCTMTPPYRPVVKDKRDMANFNARKEDMPPVIHYKDPRTGWDANFATST